jgi:hypothetical protein
MIKGDIKRSLRAARGSYQISEFGVALYCLVALVLIPLANLSVLPLRWSLAKSLIGSQVHRYAQAETFSQALREAAADEAGQGLQKIGGIKNRTQKLVLVVESAKLQGQRKYINRPGAVPTDWLPDGANAPYVYRLELSADCAIAPLFLLPLAAVKIPGLTVPLAVQFEHSAVFENRGRDPNSGEYCLNE